MRARPIIASNEFRVRWSTSLANERVTEGRIVCQRCCTLDVPQVLRAKRFVICDFLKEVAALYVGITESWIAEVIECLMKFSLPIGVPAIERPSRIGNFPYSWVAKGVAREKAPHFEAME